MINYHGKFIRNLSSILQPLNQLLQGNRHFKWSPRCKEAFKKAKDSLSSSNVLVHYDPSLPVILESDASQYGIGAVIFHRFPMGDERPIAYASKSLNSSEKNYSQIEKESLAIIFGVAKFYMYLFGLKFTLRTDHKPLLKIFVPDSANPVLAAARLQSWSLLLSSNHYETEFRSSAEVASADALSRLPLRADKCWEVKRALRCSFNVWCGVGLARALFPRFRWAWRPGKFSFLQTGNPIFFL